MNDLLRIAALFALVTLSLIAFFAVLGVLFPLRVSKTYAAIQAMPGRAFAVGLVNGLFFGALAAVLLSLSKGPGVLALPGLLVAALLAVGLSVGVAGVVEIVGERLFPQAGRLGRTAGGTLALWLACLLPFVGWVLLFGYVAFLGLGGFVLSYFARPLTPAPAAVE
jgi:hypothetical protein